MFKHLLLTTDLLDEASKAAPLAVWLAKQFNAKITLLHVDEIAASGFASALQAGEWLADVAPRREQRLARQLAALDVEGVTVVAAERTGYAATEVVQFAAAEDVDLIIMTHRVRERGFRLGSTCKSVLRRSKRPVLVVPEAPGRGPWRELTRFVVGTDLTDESAMGLQVTSRLAHRMGASWVPVHVWSPFTWVGGVDWTTGMDTPKKVVDHYEASVTARVADWFGSHAAWAPDCRLVCDDDPALGLLDTAIAERAHVVVAPTHGKGRLAEAILGSTTRTMVQHAQLPVLAIPPEWFEDAKEAAHEGPLSSLVLHPAG